MSKKKEYLNKLLEDLKDTEESTSSSDETLEAFGFSAEEKTPLLKEKDISSLSLPKGGHPKTDETHSQKDMSLYPSKTQGHSTLPIATTLIENSDLASSATNHLVADPDTPIRNLSVFCYDLKSDPTNSSRMFLYCIARLSDLGRKDIRTEETQYKGELSGESFTSITIVVTSVEQTLYFVRREYSVEMDQKSAPSERLTDQPATFEACSQEIEAQGLAAGIREVRMKPVFRKVPSFLISNTNLSRDKLNCVKAKYQATNKEFFPRSSDPTADPRGPTPGGRTYAGVFGLRTDKSTAFALKNKIKGPCWLSIGEMCRRKAAQKNKAAFFYVVDSMKQISVEGGSLKRQKIPPLRTAILSTKQSNKHLFLATLTCLGSLAIEGSDHRVSNGTFIANTVSYIVLDQKRVSPELLEGLEVHSRKRGIQLRVFSSEEELVGRLASDIRDSQVDLLVGFDIFSGWGFHFADHFSRNSSLFSRSPLPLKNKRFHGSRKEKVAAVFEGRLLADVFLLAKEFASLRSYSLEDIKEHLLGEKEKAEFSLEASFVDASAMHASLERLLQASKGSLLSSILVFFESIKKNEMENKVVWLATKKLNVLPLTYHLSLSCGCPWSLSLNVQRARRSDFLLMHEFRQNKWLLPEPGSQEHVQEGKRPTFTGGLVLEPKKGFYSNYLLLLDFNSLYPSLIIEYNLCLSTLPEFLKKRALCEAPEEFYDTIPVERKGLGQANRKVPSGSKAANFSEAVDQSIEISGEDMEKATAEASLAEKGCIARVLERLLYSRNEVKTELSALNHSSMKSREEAKRLEVQQKALKLAANSLYGTLGFPSSLFYCPRLPALVTALGRKALKIACEVVEKSGRGEVVYGDTDSVVVSTSFGTWAELTGYANEIKAEIKKRYKFLRLGLDGVFARMLLLAKKRYAGLTVEVTNRSSTPSLTEKDFIFKKEFKGLDLVRRDSCPLVKDSCVRILDLILSRPSLAERKVLAGLPEQGRGDEGDGGEDDAFFRILVALEGLKLDIDNGLVQVDQFIITKALNKDPEMYADAAGLPQVAVAKRLRQAGETINAGNLVEFLITEGKGSLAERAFTPKEFKERGLTLDINFYLHRQLLPAVKRILEGVFSERISEVYKIFGIHKEEVAEGTSAAGEGLGDALTEGFSWKQGFWGLESPTVCCPVCGLEQVFEGVLSAGVANVSKDDLESLVVEMAKTLTCKREGCPGFFSSLGSSKYGAQKEGGSEGATQRLAEFSADFRSEVFRFLRKPLDSAKKVLFKCMEEGRRCSSIGCSFSTNEILSSHHDRYQRHICSELLKPRWGVSRMSKQISFFLFTLDVELLLAESVVSSSAIDSLCSYNEVVLLFAYLKRCYESAVEPFLANRYIALQSAS